MSGLTGIDETVAFAIGAERPVVITYVAASGERTTRTIEPYEFAPTGEGHLIVRAMDRRSGMPRSFRLDRIAVQFSRFPVQFLQCGDIPARPQCG